MVSVDHWRRQVGDLHDNTETVAVDKIDNVLLVVGNTEAVLLAVDNQDTVLLVVGNTESVLLAADNPDIAVDTAVVDEPFDIEDQGWSGNTAAHQNP